MTHPIKSYMPTVFIPVQQLKRSIEWYCELLDTPVQPKQDGGGIYYFNFAGTDLILDSNQWGFPPMIMFDSDDIDEAYSFCRQRGYEQIGELYRRGGVAHFNVGSNMICYAEHRGKTGEHELAHPLLPRIARVIVHADDAAASEAWYAAFLDRTAAQDRWVEDLRSFRMDHGADLLIDDNRLSRTETVHFERLQLELRAHPAVIIATPDIEAARRHVLDKSPSQVSDIQHRLGLDLFTFADPDGNGWMVAQQKKL